eukprot:m.5666 g.5666  ORF g.5666 m.5666 type:complete len:59 (-) comp7838_c0_seq1:912-1088(-)
MPEKQHDRKVMVAKLSRECKTFVLEEMVLECPALLPRGKSPSCGTAFAGPIPCLLKHC